MAVPEETSLYWRQRAGLALVLVVLSAILLLERTSDRRRVDAAERSRLAGQARTVEANLVHQLRATRAALLAQAVDFKATPRPLTDDAAVQVQRRLAEVSAVMSGVSAMRWLDAQGRTVASNRPAGSDGSGLDAAPGADGPAAGRRNPTLQEPDTMAVAPPFRTAQGNYALDLSVAVQGPGGAWLGHVVATLDSSYFETLLGSVLYAPDMRAALAHGDGVAVVYSPARSVPPGTDLARPGSMFMRHRQTGQSASVLEGPVVTTGERRLIAQRTVQPPELRMDRPLVLAISRSSAAVHAAWQQRSGLLAALWLLVVASSVFTLLAVQRRRHERRVVEQARLQERAVAAEHLELALAGAELALWDLDVASGRCTVNPRWYTMLGEEPDAATTTALAWTARLHPEDRDHVMALQSAHLQGASPNFQATYRLRHRLGHWVWVLDRGRVVERDGNGRALRMAGTHMDISDRMQAEQTLRESEQTSRELLGALRSGVVVHASDTRIVSANASACRILGLTLQQLQGRQAVDPAWHFLEEDGSAMALERYPVNQVIATGQLQQNFVVGLRRPDLAQPMWALCNAFAVHGPAGELKQVVVTFSDITERQHAEAALRASEAHLRMASRMARLGAWRVELSTRQVTLAPDMAQALGLPAGPALDAETTLQRVAPAGRERLRQRLLDCLQGGAPVDDEIDFTGPQGRAMRLRVLGEVVPGRQGRAAALQGAVQDLSEHHHALQQLQLLQASIERLNDVVLITQADPLAEPGPRIVFVNAAFERLTGWRRDEVLGRSPRLLQGPLTDTQELARVSRALALGEAVRAELVNYGKSGQTYWIEMDIVPLRGPGGQPSHFVAVQRDVTERRQAQQQVRAAQQELAATLDAVPDLLFDIDLQGRVHGQHSPRQDQLHVPAGAFLGRRVAEFLPAEAAAVIAAALHEAHARGSSQGLQYEQALPGGVRWFELSVSRKATPPGEVPRFIALARDISDRKQAERQGRDLEAQLREAQKMESIGTLAGGIAHDFNNILAAILGNVALASEELPAGHSAQGSLDQIQKAGLRARSLVQQILAFSRSKPQQLEAQALQPVLEETLALLRATMPASVRLGSQLPDAPLRIEADATQLQQVLLNLCTNAWHALPEGRGSVEVGLAVLPSDADGLPVLPSPAPEGMVHLWVRDDGVGMDEHTRQRIFDPFFTTKPVGKGTGLGLAVVHGIVRGHGGAITVDSEPGRGSSFDLYFPLAPAASGMRVAPVVRPSGGAGQGQHVLVVDDDEVLTVLVQRLLQRAGYRVTVCSGAQPALALLREPARAVDLVVSDFNMPGMTGLDLAQALQALHPGLPVIISSGYITQELSDRAEQLGVRALMKKENTLEELTALVQRTLDAAA